MAIEASEKFNDLEVACIKTTTKRRSELKAVRWQLWNLYKALMVLQKRLEADATFFAARLLIDVADVAFVGGELLQEFLRFGHV